MNFIFLFHLLCWKPTVQDYVYVRTYVDIDMVIKAAENKDCKIEYYDSPEPSLSVKVERDFPRNSELSLKTSSSASLANW